MISSGELVLLLSDQLHILEFVLYMQRTVWTSLRVSIFVVLQFPTQDTTSVLLRAQRKKINALMIVIKTARKTVVLKILNLKILTTNFQRNCTDLCGPTLATILCPTLLFLLYNFPKYWVFLSMNIYTHREDKVFGWNNFKSDQLASYYER